MAVPKSGSIHDRNTSIFDDIYAKNLWGKAGAGSGTGSTLATAAGASHILFHVMLSLNASKVIDAPCGALEWQTPLLPKLARNVGASRFEYTGIDIAHAVVANNAKVLGQESPFRVRFLQANLAESALPAGALPADLIFSRDALQHNSLADVWKILWSFAQAGPTHLLLGSYPCVARPLLFCASHRMDPGLCRCQGNVNVPTGGVFGIDLAKHPFELTPERVYDEGDFYGKHLYLYSRDSFRAQLASAAAKQKHRHTGQLR